MRAACALERDGAILGRSQTGGSVAFDTLSEYEQDSVIEFLKTLQVLPPGTQALIVDEQGKKKIWPPPP